MSYFTQVDCAYQLLNELVEFARDHQKPVLIAESTPQRYDIQNLTWSQNGIDYEDRSAEEIWEAWFVPYFDFIYSNADIIRAITYINARWDDQPMWASPYADGYWGDSRVQANDYIFEQWRNEVNKDVWIHTDSAFESMNPER